MLYFSCICRSQENRGYRKLENTFMSNAHARSIHVFGCLHNVWPYGGRAAKSMHSTYTQSAQNLLHSLSFISVQ